VEHDATVHGGEAVKVRIICVGGVEIHMDSYFKSLDDACRRFEKWQATETGWVTINGDTRSQVVQLRNVIAFEAGEF
jgi:hypothetical protein